MKKAVLISIKPEWCEKINSGEKTIEVRKTKPKLEPPFKCYIYCTSVKALPLELYVKLHAQTGGAIDEWSGKVFASFVCNRIDVIVPTTEPYGIYDIDDDYVLQTCLENGALWDYGRGGRLYGWHISDLKIYDYPKNLKDFNRPCSYYHDCFPCIHAITDAETNEFSGCDNVVETAPQSWCYVEELV